MMGYYEVSSKEVSSGLGDAREKCTAELIHRKQGCPSSLIHLFTALLHLFDILISFEACVWNTRFEVSRFTIKEKGFY